MMDDGLLTGEWLAETWWCEVTREGSVGDWMAGQRRGCGRGSPRTTCLRTSLGPGPVVLRPARTSLMAGRSRARHSNDATYLTTMTAPACGVAVRSLHDPRCQVSWPTHTRYLHSPPSPINIILNHSKMLNKYTDRLIAILDSTDSQQKNLNWFFNSDFSTEKWQSNLVSSLNLLQYHDLF